MLYVRSSFISIKFVLEHEYANLEIMNILRLPNIFQCVFIIWLLFSHITAAIQSFKIYNVYYNVEHSADMYSHTCIPELSIHWLYTKTILFELV